MHFFGYSTRVYVYINIVRTMLCHLFWTNNRTAQFAQKIKRAFEHKLVFSKCVEMSHICVN